MGKYKTTKFMLPTSHYDKQKADYAVSFIQCLKHTKGIWAGKPFELMPWQEQIVRDLFGVIKPNGYRQFNTAYVEISKKQGKEVSLNTLIPTPQGFTTMKNLRKGDVVFDENGYPCHVVAKSEVDYDEQAYRITFKDGQVIEAGANHQWLGEATWRNPRKKMIATTEELYNCRDDKGCYRFRIAVAKSILTEVKDLPIHPYLMGYWLGNGNATEPKITVQT